MARASNVVLGPRRWVGRCRRASQPPRGGTLAGRGSALYRRTMILVTGISGVGKSYTVERVVAAAAGLEHVRASELLARAGRPVSFPTPSEMEENQRILCQLLTERDSAAGGGLVLDGHAILETRDGPRPTPSWIFDAVPISAFLCVQDDPEVVAIRREAKHGRQEVTRVRALQEAEETYSRNQANRLGVPFHVVRSGDVEGFRALVKPLS